MQDYKIYVPKPIGLILSIDEHVPAYVLPAGLYDVYSDNENHEAAATVAEIKLPGGKMYRIPFGQATFYGYEYSAMSVSPQCDPQMLEDLHRKTQDEVFELLESLRPHQMTVHEYVYGQNNGNDNEHTGFGGDFHRALRAALLYDWSFRPNTRRNKALEMIRQFNNLLFL